MINRKYHDIKHLIVVLRAEPDAQVRERWLQAVEADIQAYEVQNKTGNRVLDTVLTGKSLYCRRQGIELLVVADGKLLSFMDVADICTVFGNALDNAIECELKIPDPSKRIIRLVLSAQKQFLLLKVENYCPFHADFRDGLPATTKEDPSNHGFGLKSIRHTAQKYGGSITTGIEDDWFVLKMPKGGRGSEKADHQIGRRGAAASDPPGVCDRSWCIAAELLWGNLLRAAFQNV